MADPALPQSAFPYPSGAATPGTPTGSVQVVSKDGSLAKRGQLYIKAGWWVPVPGWNATPPDWFYDVSADGKRFVVLNQDPRGRDFLVQRPSKIEGSSAVRLEHRPSNFQ
jgi:hypothetical protein